MHYNGGLEHFSVFTYWKIFTTKDIKIEFFSVTFVRYLYRYFKYMFSLFHEIAHILLLRVINSRFHFYTILLLHSTIRFVRVICAVVRSSITRCFDFSCTRYAMVNSCKSFLTLKAARWNKSYFVEISTIKWHYMYVGAVVVGFIAVKRKTWIAIFPKCVVSPRRSKVYSEFIKRFNFNVELKGELSCVNQSFGYFYGIGTEGFNYILVGNFVRLKSLLVWEDEILSSHL